ncbi:integral membrane protein [Elaphomyces granulatus]
MAATTSAPTSIWNRKLDLLHLIFFVTHIIILYLVDLVPFYPPGLTLQLHVDIRNYYKDNYQDKFFENPPAWFVAFCLMELVYHLPISIWAVGALLRDDPLVPLHLILWATQTFLTTLTCLIEMWSWTDRTGTQKYNLTMIYAPYIGYAVMVGIDMFLRLRSQLLRKRKVE